VGGEGSAAQRRAARYGDAWFPYFVRITPADLGERWRHVRQQAQAAGRDPAEISLNLNLPIEVTDQPVPQQPDRLRGSPEQLLEALQPFAALGVQHLALQFMVPHYPQRLAQIERFAATVLPRIAR
jgi:alkanesulfonate monooxygenase SsuD/methylene tetrahydromethanopterin reductase-like flavin-dependent oxidoreductase (luciferase family)